MIRISLGNVGSGKTANEVREMAVNKAHRKTYSNIITKHIPNSMKIDPSMIIDKQQVSEKRKKDGTLEPVYEMKLNLDFWKGRNEPINCVLDEAHSIINSRRAMSKINIIVTDWIALMRRVLGSSGSGEGELVFVTQLPNRIDNIARDMAHQVRYHKCHYIKTCKKCNFSWRENSEMPEILYECPRCKGYSLIKHNHKLEIWKFFKMENYILWKDLKEKSWYSHYLVTDIEKYFPMYNTLQWDNLFSEFY